MGIILCGILVAISFWVLAKKVFKWDKNVVFILTFAIACSSLMPAFLVPGTKIERHVISTTPLVGIETGKGDIIYFKEDDHNYGYVAQTDDSFEYKEIYKGEGRIAVIEKITFYYTESQEGAYLETYQSGFISNFWTFSARQEKIDYEFHLPKN